jgi:ComF family protein
MLCRNESTLCLACYIEIPRTGFHNDPENEVSRLFWGRVPIKHATAFMYFSKTSRYRQILHELKYRGQQETGLEMGRIFGMELRKTAFAAADMIHPVPLHPSKQKKRGYNQSELIARGISEVTNIPLETGGVRKISGSSTQTRKSKYERWENVKDIFRVDNPQTVRNKHILLVDDVITTGATMEACASVLLAEEGVTVSLASLAYTKLY